MKSGPNETVECVNCQKDFELPPPATDVIYIPKCPKCGTVVDGYEEAAEERKRNQEAARVCEEIEQELHDAIRESKKTREQVPEGTALAALHQLTEDLHKISDHAVDKTEELTEVD